jgi:hypothetical protein
LVRRSLVTIFSQKRGNYRDSEPIPEAWQASQPSKEVHQRRRLKLDFPAKFKIIKLFQMLAKNIHPIVSAPD